MGAQTTLNPKPIIYSAEWLIIIPQCAFTRFPKHVVAIMGTLLEGLLSVFLS
jgi:hypothetical protein